jgi:parallel beta-helix repeat protein
MTITNFTYGIWLDYSPDCTLSGNNVTANNVGGIYLGSSSGNILSGDNVTANKGNGIWLSSSPNCTLSGNNVADSKYGIELSVSSDNFISHNNFVNNANQVSTQFSANTWIDGSIGNYWGDYLTKYPNAAQVDSSGIWNTPYVIDANNTDHYPLVVQYVIPEFPSIQATMFFILLTLLTVTIYKRKGVKTSQSKTEPRRNAWKTFGARSARMTRSERPTKLLPSMSALEGFRLLLLCLEP